MISFKRYFKSLLRSCGIDIVKYLPCDMGFDPYVDMGKFFNKNDNLLIIDAGANVGESVDSILSIFPNCNIHCFEPCLTSFKKLHNRNDIKKVCSLWNIGLGKEDNILHFYENEYAYLSSFLQTGIYGYGKIVENYPCRVVALDSFAISKRLEFIDILKIDTQGFEIDVLMGASKLLRLQRIRLIHVELTFSERYVTKITPLDIVKLLTTSGFVLVGIYRQHFQERLLSWADALFINENYLAGLNKP